MYSFEHILFVVIEMIYIFSKILKNQKFMALRALFSRLLGRFAPIFYLNCEYVIFVYILKQRRKNIEDLKKNSRIFKNLIFFLQNEKPLKHIF